MSTRQRARRRKGATRQTTGPAWTDTQRGIYEYEQEDFECEVLRGNALAVRSYWQSRLGPQATYVYLAQPVGRTAVKIGYAANPLGRLAELQCGNPDELQIVALMLGSKATERALHLHWREANIRGEWYDEGYAAAIGAMVEVIAEQQITEHGQGFDMLYVRDALPSLVLKERAAA